MRHFLSSRHAFPKTKHGFPKTKQAFPRNHACLHPKASENSPENKQPRNIHYISMYVRTYNRYTAQALTNGIIRIFATKYSKQEL